MPAKSKAQQRAAGAALSAKRGDQTLGAQRRVEADVQFDERKAARRFRVDQAQRQTELYAR